MFLKHFQYHYLRGKQLRMNHLKNYETDEETLTQNANVNKYLKYDLRGRQALILARLIIIL